MRRPSLFLKKMGLTSVLKALARIYIFGLLLASCRSVPAACLSTPSSISSLPSVAPTLVRLTSVGDLISILEASDPASPSYAPGSPAFAEFPDVLARLAAANAPTNDAASMLAYAMGFPRPDSYLAARMLVSLGSDWVSTTLPSLVSYLADQRASLRMFSALVLSVTGERGSCSLGQVGPLLWDSDPSVRTAAALALQGITGHVLVRADYLLRPDQLSPDSVTPDLPEGTITVSARVWWTDHGSQVNWHPQYDLCDP